MMIDHYGACCEFRLRIQIISISVPAGDSILKAFEQGRSEEMAILQML